MELPPSNNFKPSGNGEGPLANLKDWINFPARPAGGSPNAKRDSNTMPTHAGAAWYFLRYMDPHNTNAFADQKALDYWNQVDVYIGGSEHAVAHLLYARLWTKVLHDLGYIKFDEPFKKLINQGKITGVSKFVYRGYISFSQILPDYKFPELLVIMLTIYDDDERIFNALCAGACGYLLKKTPPIRILESLHEAVNGGSPMSPEVARRVITLFREIRPPERADYDLTPHETKLLKNCLMQIKRLAKLHRVKPRRLLL